MAADICLDIPSQIEYFVACGKGFSKPNLIMNICSLSDGPVGESTGTPYIYATPLEISFHDLKVNPQASITMSLAQVQDSLKLKT